MKNDFFKVSPRRTLFSAIVASTFLFSYSVPAWADMSEVNVIMQAVKVSGKVVDVNGEPIIGANVKLKGSTMVL